MTFSGAHAYNVADSLDSAYLGPFIWFNESDLQSPLNLVQGEQSHDLWHANCDKISVHLRLVYLNLAQCRGLDLLLTHLVLQNKASRCFQM